MKFQDEICCWTCAYWTPVSSWWASFSAPRCWLSGKKVWSCKRGCHAWKKVSGDLQDRPSVKDTDFENRKKGKKLL